MAGAAAFANEGTAAAEPGPDDWEIVVDLADEVAPAFDVGSAGATTGTLDAAEVPGMTGASDAPETFEIVDMGDLARIAGPVDLEPVDVPDDWVAGRAVAESTSPVSAAAPVLDTVPCEPAEPEAGDDAALIAELVAAADAPSLRFQAAVQLGRIFLQRGDLGRGIEWLEQACGVTAPVRDHGLLARYDLADALERAGERARALDVLSDLEMDAGSYRDVSARITRLSRATGSAP